MFFEIESGHSEPKTSLHSKTIKGMVCVTSGISGVIKYDPGGPV